MAQPYVGEIRMFAGNFAPAAWMFCEGQLLPISENETLFQLIGTTYGGDGESNFGLPDLRGRIPMHQGNGFTLAETGGAEEITLTSTTFDTFLYLVGPGDQVLAADDNGMPGGTNASLRVYAPAGDYLVVASSANPGATGAYQLSSRAITARTGCVDQGWIVPGVSLTGSLATGDCTAGDGSRYDLYPVVLRAGQRLTVTMRSTAFDSYLLLLSSDGRLVASNDDGAGGDDSLITYTAPAGGVYLIIANSFSASGAGTYTLTVTSP